MWPKTITIKEYLTQKGIPFREQNGEIITHCLFSHCDDDSSDKEGHLYFNAETGQYSCKKCGAKGNITTLSKYFGDSIDEIQKESLGKNSKNCQRFDNSLVEKCASSIPERIRNYLNSRNITNQIIKEYKLGWGKFYHKWWITIPIQDKDGNYIFFKLREDPEEGDKKITYPKGAKAQIYDWKTLNNAGERIVISEGELDKLLLQSKGINAITSTHGALTFKEDWVYEIEKAKSIREIYICFDNDETGREGAEKIAKIIHEKLRDLKVYIINLPASVGEKGDVTDFFVKLNGKVSDFFCLAQEYPEKINTKKFKPISLSSLSEILGLSIKRDDYNKIVTFLCELSAYTDDSQFNISFNAPSSTGKSYIPTEIAKLFPEEDVIEVGYSSPTAFFHEKGFYDKEKNCYIVDFSRKILIFLDQPHSQLIQRLRPMLSHDKKEITLKITDKTEKYGLRTKNVILKGYPSVIFCTAGLKNDEQEATRFILLSPETSKEKIREAIQEKIRKESDREGYELYLEENLERKLLKERIYAIKEENIKEIKISSEGLIEEKFFKLHRDLKPKYQRDIGKIISIVKALALLNLWWRERDSSTLSANEEDINSAFEIWTHIYKSQEYNLPPYVYAIYTDVIIPAYEEINRNPAVAKGLTRKDIKCKYFSVYKRHLPDWQLRQEIIPMLEDAGLISQEEDNLDKRKMLVYPVVLEEENRENLNYKEETIKNEESQESNEDEYLTELFEYYDKEEFVTPFGKK